MEIKSSTSHMDHRSLSLWGASNFLLKFGLTSMTTCLESSNVLLVNFFWRMLSSRWVRLFSWRIVFFMSASSTSFGTNLSGRVGSSFLGRPTVLRSFWLAPFLRCLGPFQFYISQIPPHLLGSLFCTHQVVVSWGPLFP